MGTIADMRDIASLLSAKACGAANGVAAGAGDNTAVTGASINRKTPGGIGFNACVLALAYKCVQAGATTFSLQVEVQEADDNGSGAPGAFGTATVLQASSVAQTGPGTVTGMLELADPNFASRKQWVRYNYTPDLSAGATDTFVTALSAILGGADILPA
jgi:hypothetical protein